MGGQVTWPFLNFGVPSTFGMGEHFKFVKVGFHYPSSRPEFTARVDGPRTQVHFLTPVNSGRELG